MKPASKHSIGKMSREVTREGYAKRNTLACSRGLFRPPFTISPEYFSRLKKNRRQWLYKVKMGGEGVNNVHYGLCENGEFDIRIARSQARSSQNSNRQP